MHYVYLIRNNVKHNVYVGYTGNLKARLLQHRDKKPELLYYEAYKSESDARLRERMLKHKGQGLRRLKERLPESLK